MHQPITSATPCCCPDQIRKTHRQVVPHTHTQYASKEGEEEEEKNDNNMEREKITVREDTPMFLALLL